MPSQPDGGPAFPRPLSTGIIIREGVEQHIDCFPQAGMSLRDWFAGQALAGIQANPHFDLVHGEEYTAERAYAYADAMLSAREKVR